MDKATVKTVAVNRKARHDYFIEDTYEAGIALSGAEVKSARAGKISLKESHAGAYGGELFIYDMNISAYEQGNIHNKEPRRARKLLLHRSEINKLIGLATRDGYTIIPLQAYFKNGRLKIELAVAKGKKLYDKRHTSAEKSAKRDMDRALKSNCG